MTFLSFNLVRINKTDSIIQFNRFENVQKLHYSTECQKSW